MVGGFRGRWVSWLLGFVDVGFHGCWVRHCVSLLKSLVVVGFGFGRHWVWLSFCLSIRSSSIGGLSISIMFIISSALNTGKTFELDTVPVDLLNGINYT